MKNNRKNKLLFSLAAATFLLTGCSGTEDISQVFLLDPPPEAKDVQDWQRKESRKESQNNLVNVSVYNQTLLEAESGQYKFLATITDEKGDLFTVFSESGKFYEQPNLISTVFETEEGETVFEVDGLDYFKHIDTEENRIIFYHSQQPIHNNLNQISSVEVTERHLHIVDHENVQEIVLPQPQNHVLDVASFRNEKSTFL